MRDYILISLTRVAENVCNNYHVEMHKKALQLQDQYPDIGYVHVVARMLVEYQSKHYPWLTLDQKNRNGMWIAREIIQND